MTVGKERPLVWRHCVYCINFIPFASTPSVKWNCVVQCSLQKFHFSSHTATSCTICFGKKADRSGRKKFGARARMNSAKKLLSMRAHGSAQQINMQNMSHSIFIFFCSLIFAEFMYARMPWVGGLGFPFGVTSSASSNWVHMLSKFVECARSTRACVTFWYRVGNFFTSS